MGTRFTRRSFAGGAALSVPLVATAWGAETSSAAWKTPVASPPPATPTTRGRILPDGTNLAPGSVPTTQPILGTTLPDLHYGGTVRVGVRPVLRSGNTIIMQAGSTSGDLTPVALDVDTLAERWRGETIAGLFAVTESLAFVQGTPHSEAEPGPLVALDLATGQEAWRAEVGRFDVVLPYGIQVIVTGEHFLSLSIADGAEQWTADGAGGLYRWAAGDDVIVGSTLGSDDHFLSAFDLNDGAYLWSADLETEHHSPPIVLDGQVTVAVPGLLLNYDLASGKMTDLNTHGILLMYEGSIAATSDVIVVGGIQEIVALDRVRREQVWSYRPIWGVSNRAPLVVTDTHALVPTNGTFQPGDVPLDQSTIYEAVNLVTGQPEFEVPAREDVRTTAATVRTVVPGNESVVVFTDAEGVHQYTGSGQPYAGVPSPLDGSHYDDAEFGYALAWSDPWKPLLYTVSSGAAEIRLVSHAQDAWLIATTRSGGDFPDSLAAARGIAEAPTGTALESANRPLEISASPIDVTMAGEVETPALPSGLPDGMAMAAARYATGLPAPFDALTVSVLAVAIPGADRWLILQLAGYGDAHDASLDAFIEVARSLRFQGAARAVPELDRVAAGWLVH